MFVNTHFDIKRLSAVVAAILLVFVVAPQTVHAYKKQTQVTLPGGDKLTKLLEFDPQYFGSTHCKFERKSKHALTTNQWIKIQVQYFDGKQWKLEPSFAHRQPMTSKQEGPDPNVAKTSIHTKYYLPRMLALDKQKPMRILCSSSTSSISLPIITR